MRTVVIVGAMLVLVSRAVAQPSDAPVQPPGLTAPVRSTPSSGPLPSGFSSSGPNVPGAQPVALQFPRRDSARLPGEVDENTAVTLPLLTTLGSWTVLIAGASSNNGGLALAGFLGTLIAPGSGRWYAGESAAAGMSMRLGGALLFVFGFGAAVSHDGECDFEDECHQSSETVPAALLLGGLGLYAAGTIYDLATAGPTARDHNLKIRRARGLALAPMVQPGATGLMLGGRF